MKNERIQSILLADRVHHLFLENVKYELQCLNLPDITNTQAIILYNIGDDTMTVNELTQRKHYLGSNVTYNLRKMVEAGYLKQTPSEFDKRSSYVSPTEKGLHLYHDLDRAFQKYLDTVSKTELTNFNEIIKDMEASLMSHSR
jgi:DNA-binding MarR family transcriptional regulator